MKALALLKSFPKRFLTLLYNGAVKVQNLHHNSSFTFAQAKQALLKYNSIVQTQYKIRSFQLKSIIEQNMSRYPFPLFILYFIAWICFHYLVFQIASYQIRRNGGKGILEAMSERIAEKNKPFVLELIKERLFENEKVRREIELTFKEIPHNQKIHQSLESALSNLIVTEFIKMHASQLSVNGFKVLVVDNMTEKHLRKLVISLLSNSYIKKQLKTLILNYLSGESFSQLVVSQLSGLIETAYTKRLLADMVQSTFKNITKDPYTRHLLLQSIKDWLI